MKNDKIWQHVMLDSAFQTRSEEGTAEMKCPTLVRSSQSQTEGRK